MRLIILFAAAASMVAISFGGECLKLDFSPTPASRLKEQIEARKVKLTIDRCSGSTSPLRQGSGQVTTGKAPAIDGVLDDAAWNNAANTSLPGTPKTSLKICFDDTALYIGLDCQGAPGYKAQLPEPAVEQPRDGDAWGDDYLEIFFLPPGAEPVRYQFVISALNSIYDGRGQASNYDPDWSHAVKRGESGWTAELAIPYQALELAGPVRSIGFNIHREGPNLPIRTWANPDRDAGAGCLNLAGVTDEGIKPAKVSAEQSQTLVVAGTSLGIQMERLEAEPGERWIPIELTLRPRGALADSKIEARLYAIGKTEPLEVMSRKPETNMAVLKVDLLPKGLDYGRVEVSLLEGEAITGSAAMILSRKPSIRPLKAGEKIPVMFDVIKGMEPAEAWPVTFSLPFAGGALWETKDVPLPIRLVDSSGAEIPAQFEVMARWAPEGSVKWLRADALVLPNNGCFMEAKPPADKKATALTLVQEGDMITIETGAAKFILGKGASPIREIFRGGARVAWSEGTRGLYLVDQNGQTAKASAVEETMQIEAKGPIAACVRFEGWYKTEKSESLARHITRVEAFAEQAFLRVTHTLVLTEDTNKTWFKELGWEFAVEPGASPEAVFGLAPPAVDFKKTITAPLKGRVKSAYMFQDDHYRFAHGTNHFEVGRSDSSGLSDKSDKLQHGEECGDWAALQGKAGGFLAGCRDAARQHPKEFGIFENKVVLKLFSPRAGEELDYRTTTLMKRWYLPEWINTHNTKGGAVNGRRDETQFISKVAAYLNNASGGARTHDLIFAATGPATAPESLARLGSLHGAQVLALADPFWSYQTRVMGANYPRDPKRFPDFEKGVDALVNFFMDRDSAWGEHGFLDYYAGPHAVGYMENRVPSLFRYIEFSYYFRAQIWLLYARSGDRAIRLYATGTNRSYLDNRFVHWGDKTGYFRCDNGAVINEVPIYWHNSYRMLELGELVDNFMFSYYLTCDRRMKDGLNECAQAFKAGWSESKVTSDWTKNSIVQHCMQMYAFTGDEELGAMGMRTLDLITDQENGIFLAKRAYNSSTYKAGQAIRSLMTAYLQYPTPKLMRVCRRVAEYLQDFPYHPFGYTPPGSIVGPLLYDLTRDPAQAQSLAIAARNIGGLYDPKTGKLDTGMIPKVDGCYATPFMFDAGYVLDALVRSGLDKANNISSWVSYTDDLGGATPIIRKGDKEAFSLHFQAAGRPTVSILDSVANQVSQGDIGVINAHSMGPKMSKGQINIPKDVPPGDYMIKFDARGPAALFATATIPLVLYAPDYWLPLSVGGRGEPDRQRPPLKFFFNIPKDSATGRIFFSDLAQLYDPEGKPWPADPSTAPTAANKKGLPSGLSTGALACPPKPSAKDGAKAEVTSEAKAQEGWVDLPADKPGLWSFALIQQGLVRVVNLPPFFAFNDPKAYFEPIMDWKTSRPAVEPPFQTNTLYVTGPGGVQSNLALNVSGRKYFQIDPPKEQENSFIPNVEGTLEFYIRPNWNFFDLKEGETRGLVSPGFFVDVRPNAISFCWDVAGKIGRIPFAGNRTGPSMLLKDRWTHIAIVWGPTPNPEVISGQYGAKSITSQERLKKVAMTVYVNGKQSTQTYNNSPIPAEGQPFLPLTYLVIGGLGKDNRLDAAIDNLRLSDSQRYQDDFSPPPAESEFRPDAHTRALFLFNGNIQGEGFGLAAPLAGMVKE